MWGKNRFAGARTHDLVLKKVCVDIPTKTTRIRESVGLSVEMQQYTIYSGVDLFRGKFICA